MCSKHKIINQEEAVGAGDEAGAIKNTKREAEGREVKFEQIIEWSIYIIIVLLLAWVAFKAPILK